MKKDKPQNPKSKRDKKDFEFIKGLNIEVRGKLGKKIYGVSKLGKPYTRKMPKKKYRPASRAQRASRAVMKLLNKEWDLLPTEKKLAWKYALIFRVLRRNPETRTRALIQIPSDIISAQNYFLELNMLARSVGQTEIIAEPPFDVINHKPFPSPAAPLIRDVLFDNGKLTVSWVGNEEAKADDFVRIWLYSKEEKFHTQLAGFAPARTNGFVHSGRPALLGVLNITGVRARKGVVLDVSELTGTTIFIQADVVNKATGLASNPCTTLIRTIHPAQAG